MKRGSGEVTISPATCFSRAGVYDGIRPDQASRSSHVPPARGVDGNEDTSITSSMPANAPDDELHTAAEQDKFEPLLNSLSSAMRWNRWIAVAMLTIGIIGAVPLLLFLHDITAQSVDTLTDPSNRNNYMLGVFELLRGAAYAGLAGSILFGIFTLGRAALDQATRYEKRKMAAHFMHYVIVRYDEQIQSGDIKLKEVIKIIEAWSSIVESAYTRVRIGSKQPEKWAASVNKDGVSMRFGSTQPVGTDNGGKPRV